jgi:hypothetical protein
MHGSIDGVSPFLDSRGRRRPPGKEAAVWRREKQEEAEAFERVVVAALAADSSWSCGIDLPGVGAGGLGNVEEPRGRRGAPRIRPASTGVITRSVVRCRLTLLTR